MSEEQPKALAFALISGDRHAPALIRLWAAMREKEGEAAEAVSEARDVAKLMEDEAIARGEVFVSLDAVAAFAATLREEKQQEQAKAAETAASPIYGYELKVGEVVVAGRGRPAKLVHIFGSDNDTAEPLRGKANIQIPGQGPVTVDLDVLRRALPEEVETYRNAGGRI